MYKIIFLDVETSGIETHDRLCQLALRTGDGLSTFSGLFKPPVPISVDAMSITNITNEMVEDEPTFIGSITWEWLKTLFADPETVLVAHNAVFDVGFLLKEGICPQNYICTLKIAHHLDTEGKLDKYNLQYLRYYHKLEVGTVSAHDALGDVLVLEQLFNLYKKEMSVEEMIEVSKKPILFKKIPFGKYKKMFFRDIPKDYLMWLRRQADIEENMKNTLDYWINN